MNPEELLRRAFEARANTVEVAPDALGTIRRRIARNRPRRRAITIGLASLATTAAAAVATVAIAFDLPRQATPAPPGETIDGTPTQGVFPVPVTTTTPPPAARCASRCTTWAPPTASTASSTPRPCRPTRSRGASPPPSGQALDGGAVDPDYRTRWPGTVQVRGVRIEGAVADGRPERRRRITRIGGGRARVGAAARVDGHRRHGRLGRRTAGPRQGQRRPACA